LFSEFPRDVVAEILDPFHEKVGVIILKNMKFPPEFLSIAGFHHTPDKAVHSREMAYVVYLANKLCHAIGEGYPPLDDFEIDDEEETLCTINLGAMDALGLVDELKLHLEELKNII